MSRIVAYSRLTDSCFEVSGRSVAVERGEEQWITSAYRALGVSYPKFFKMDLLSKAGFVAAEALMSALGCEPTEPKPSTAIVLANSWSSLGDDVDYQSHIGADNYYPSPSLFVYTLANIVGGEIAIRHHISGESISYIDPRFSASRMVDYVDWAMADSTVERVVCGWVESFDRKIDVLLMAVDRTTDSGEEFTEENVEKLYNII